MRDEHLKKSITTHLIMSGQVLVSTYSIVLTFCILFIVTSKYYRLARVSTVFIDNKEVHTVLFRVWYIKSIMKWVWTILTFKKNAIMKI